MNTPTRMLCLIKASGETYYSQIFYWYLHTAAEINCVDSVTIKFKKKKNQDWWGASFLLGWIKKKGNLVPENNVSS